jgi:hypothetical protein
MELPLNRSITVLEHVGIYTISESLCHGPQFFYDFDDIFPFQHHRLYFFEGFGV